MNTNFTSKDYYTSWQMKKKYRPNYGKKPLNGDGQKMNSQPMTIFHPNYIYQGRPEAER